MPAAARREKTLQERVEWAAGAANPDIRALANAVIQLGRRVAALEQAREGDGR